MSQLGHGFLAFLWLGVATAAGAERSARANYLEHCAGCHGLLGQSASQLVPDLKGRAGYFLCTPASRSYVIRLPNITFATLTDTELAAVLNYIALDIGASARTAKFPPFANAEVTQQRNSPLAATDLINYRAAIVGTLVRSCGAPRSMIDEYRRADSRQPRQNF